jgi:AcrR family transcriptional regulator
MSGKDDLLWDIANESADRFFAALEPIVAAPREVSRKLRDAIIAHVGVITHDLDAAAVYTTEWRHLPPKRRTALAARRNAYEGLFRTLVSQGIREGLLAPVDESDATLFILSTLNYVYLWYRPDGRMTSDEVAGMLAGFIFDGLRRRTT